MGSAWSAVASQTVVQDDLTHWLLDIVRGDVDKPPVHVEFNDQAQRFRPGDISSVVPTKMLEIAEAFTEKGVKNAVITVWRTSTIRNIR